MTSEESETAYVWFWLPGAPEPVVAGRIDRIGDSHYFAYGRSFLERPESISLFAPELPLEKDRIRKVGDRVMSGVLRDACPDKWGHVTLNAQRDGSSRSTSLTELDLLLQSGSDRIGALDFQESPDVYVARSSPVASLEELLESAERVENGQPLSLSADAALLHRTSIGGSRPKALIEFNGLKCIAKFSSCSDTRMVVKAEFLAMRIAKLIGLDVSEVWLEKVSGKDVLLVQRFDRVHTSQGWCRRHMVSARTILGLDDSTADNASYPEFAEQIRQQFQNPEGTLRELFSRMAYNVMCGNTDDHAGNHSAFWDGEKLTLTPAYDICPQPRGRELPMQAMLITEDSRESYNSTCLKAAHLFSLDLTLAREILDHQIETIHRHWYEVCEEAEIDRVRSERLFDQWCHLGSFVP